MRPVLVPAGSAPGFGPDAVAAAANGPLVIDSARFKATSAACDSSRTNRQWPMTVHSAASSFVVFDGVEAD